MQFPLVLPTVCLSNRLPERLPCWPKAANTQTHIFLPNSLHAVQTLMILLVRAAQTLPTPVGLPFEGGKPRGVTGLCQTAAP